jgi:hypothetical protein
MGESVKPRPQYQPPPKVAANKRLNRRTKPRMKLDELYNAVRDVYLEANPFCALCGHASTAVHHICSGNAGRSATLLNSDTWLPICGDCHPIIERHVKPIQAEIKCSHVRETIDRLRT